MAKNKVFKSDFELYFIDKNENNDFEKKIAEIIDQTIKPRYYYNYLQNLTDINKEVRKHLKSITTYIGNSNYRDAFIFAKLLFVKLNSIIQEANYLSDTFLNNTDKTLDTIIFLAEDERVPLVLKEKATSFLLKELYNGTNYEYDYYGNKINGVSPDGLEFVGNKFVFKNHEDFVSFIKDKNNVYYLKGKIGNEKYEIIPLKVDSKSFKYSNNGFYELTNLNYTGYFEDKNGVYYFNGLAKLTPNNILSKVENADIPSFVQYMAGYAKDKNKVYCGTKEVKGADVESFAAFTIDGEDIIKDKNKIYKYTDSCEQ